MASLSTIKNVKTTLNDLFTKYSTLTKDIADDLVWQGKSKENFTGKTKEFLDAYDSSIDNQLEYLIKAVTEFENYSDKKSMVLSKKESFNSMEDKNTNDAKILKNQISTLNSEIETLKKSIKEKINNIMDLGINYEKFDSYGIIIKDDDIPRNGTAQEKMNYLFPNGVPKTSSEMAKYIVTTEVVYNDANGNRQTATIKVHKALEQDVKEIFEKVAETGFKIMPSNYGSGSYVESYCFRKKRGGNGLSQHSFGSAIDINPGVNPYRVYPTLASKMADSNNNYVVTNEVANIFRSYGWSWGGADWGKYSYDGMHFDFTEKGPVGQVDLTS